MCQKFLEFCNEEQRCAIIDHVAQDLIPISLNMHGTRAVQKMIDNVTSAPQITTIIQALDMDPVSLIKDLNGNHVIQKCLNKLGHAQNQVWRVDVVYL